MREGTILGHGFKKSSPPVQLTAGGRSCRANGAGEHSGTPSPAFLPPPWVHSESLSLWYPFYFQAEKPQLHPQCPPAKETEQNTLETQLRDRNILEQVLLQITQNKSTTTDFSGSRIRAPEGSAKECLLSSLKGHSSSSPRDLWKET